MFIEFTLNDQKVSWEITLDQTLLDALRENGFFGAKFGGCSKGECGACTVLVDGRPVNSCNLLAAQANGHEVQTIENMGERPEKGWLINRGLHPIQLALVQSGAIQCGYCTPAMALAAKGLLMRNSTPSEADVREALAPILCRCTGYVKPVQAILQAAAILRRESESSVTENGIPIDPDWLSKSLPNQFISPDLDRNNLQTKILPEIKISTQSKGWHQVGKPEIKVDAIKLVQGKPAFTADIEMRGMLVAKVLHSPMPMPASNELMPAKPGHCQVLQRC